MYHMEVNINFLLFLVMLGCTCTVLANWKEPNNWRPFSAMAVLLAWSEELLLLGRHPKLSVSYILQFIRLIIIPFTTLSFLFF